jgi:hypothetical protein
MQPSSTKLKLTRTPAKVSRFVSCPQGDTFGIFALTASSAVEKSNSGHSLPVSTASPA